MSKPESYKELDICRNCVHVFDDWDWEVPSYYYCTLNAPSRPRSYRGEGWDSESTDAKYHEKRWDEWSKGREVKLNGTCLRFEQKKKE